MNLKRFMRAVCSALYSSSDCVAFHLMKFSAELELVPLLLRLVLLLEPLGLLLEEKPCKK